MKFWAKYGLGTFQTLLELAGYYNLIPHGANQGVCKMFDGKICDTFASVFLDVNPGMDDEIASKNMMDNVPAGSGYRNWIHYWQSIPLDG